MNRYSFFISSLVWDPDRVAFEVPFIHHPVTWYGVLFAFSFFIGYFLLLHLFRTHFSERKKTFKEARALAVDAADRITVLIIIGTIIGARLGHVFFYGWPYYRANPLAILKIWEGGLASHGAAIGILLALCAFQWINRRKGYGLNFLATLDALVIPAACAGGVIRLGNLMNQEILGTPTNVPWGVIFLNPIEGPAGIPLHPVQIYESLFYFFTFVLLLFIWRRLGKKIGQGVLTGWFFILIFGFRFFIEWLKLPQSQVIEESRSLNMGQWLSIPFVLIGVILLVLYRRRRI